MSEKNKAVYVNVNIPLESGLEEKDLLDKPLTLKGITVGKCVEIKQVSYQGTPAWDCKVRLNEKGRILFDALKEKERGKKILKLN